MVYSNYCCSYSFEPEIIKVGQSSHKMYNNNIVNFQESTTILNDCPKISGNLLNAPRKYEHTMNAILLWVNMPLKSINQSIDLILFVIVGQDHALYCLIYWRDLGSNHIAVSFSLYPHLLPTLFMLMILVRRPRDQKLQIG